MNQTTQYSKVFSRICHITALTQDGKAQRVVDDLVSTSLFLFGGEQHYNESYVASSIEEAFGLVLGSAVLSASIDRQVDSGQLVRNASTHAIVLSKEVDAEIRERVEFANSLERRVRKTWLASIELPDEPLSEVQMSQLWAALSSFLSKLFQRHGVATIGLLGPKLESNDLYGKGKARLLRDAIAESCDDGLSETAAEAIPKIFESPSVDVVKYLSQLLDGTFSFFAVSTDVDTTRYLNRVLSPLSIFLDTNFIFGLLNLQGSRFSSMSDELIDTILTGRFPFSLYCHEETIKEFEATLGYYSKDLIGRKWSSAISRAAAGNATALSSIERSYHEVNAETPVSAKIFFARYRKLRPLLKPFKCEIWKGTQLATHSEREALRIQKNDYGAFLTERNHEKMGAALHHDMAVLSTVNSLKKESSSILEAGALLLTTDFHLYSYDQQIRNHDDLVGSVVMPNQLLQILRPLIPHSGDSDKQFIDTFSMPEFRTTGGDYADTQRNVLSYLNIYSDLPSETAARLLADEMLLAKLEQSSLDDEKFHELMDQALADENLALQKRLEEESLQLKEIARERDRQERELAQKDTLSQEAISEVATLQELLHQKNDEFEKLESDISRSEKMLQELQRSTEQKMSSASKDHSDELAGLESRLKKSKGVEQTATKRAKRNRNVIAALSVLVFWTFVWLQPVIAPIEGLDLHAKNILIRIIFAASAVTVALWAVFPKLGYRLWMPILLVWLAGLIAIFAA